MGKTLVLAVLVMFVCGSTALAGIGPDPSRCSCEARGTGWDTCHYAFSINAYTGDCLTLDVTLRDPFDAPVALCPTSATLTPNLSTNSLCACLSEGGLRQAGITDGGGVIQFVWCCIGGHGNLDINVTAYCTGSVAGLICSENIEFTSTDLNGSCEATNSTGVVDLGAWAAGLPPSYSVYSDYDCDGTIGVVDLGFWASGLGKGCSDCPF